MKTWRAIIVDDEPLARLEIIRLLGSYPQIIIVDEADSVQTAKNLIELLQPDLLFLDINLGTQSGFDLLEITERNFQIIFITAYDKYAIRAFEINALDYLLKPVHPERLRESIARLGHPLRNELKIKLEPFDKILVNNQSCSKFVTISSINYIEAKGDYTKINTHNSGTGIVHQTIKKWIELLPRNMFLQIHRSYIVNINNILEIKKRNNSSYQVMLSNINKQIPLSRTFFEKIKEHFRID